MASQRDNEQWLEGYEAGQKWMVGAILEQLEAWRMKYVALALRSRFSPKD